MDENSTSPSSPPRSQPRVRLQIKQGTAIGPGKAALLEALERTGSISAAGRELDMSYRRAWLLIHSVNQAYKQPLVEASKGGAGGGGAQLTPLGREVLSIYRRMERKALRAIQADLETLEKLLHD
ncbi:LysR family transcriptional regulator [Thiomonas sp.]|jgi:molybdate transport system regulatory protein|uniref:winged helix-turn-helix domain-containing protein n=1 Tax=Thiomonas sp. TaxID=2047785 RepID=UPI002632D0AE|nr:LysR family transcriptional regulator [Thiomonas sp.]